MKTKKFGKNLMLNKVTIAHLSRDEMDALRGGENDSCPCFESAESECMSLSLHQSCDPV
jgi:natural product precursor